jgi:hypothetical protein
MKLKIFFSICLIIGIAMTQLSAQSQKALDNRSVVRTELPWFYEAPVVCNGFTDVLIGSATSTSVTHYKNGEVVGSSWRTIAEATSAATGEVFAVKENSLTKADWVVTFHFNAIGEFGTRYIGSMTWDMINDPLFQNVIVNKFVCPGSKRNNQK